MKLALEHDIKLPTGVLGLSATPDGGRAFVTCVDGSVNAVNFATGEAIPLERWHESYASGCVLLRDQQTLISAGYDGALLWHDLASGECTRRVQAHNFWSWRVALSPNANLLATVTGQYLPGGWKYEPAEEQEPSVKVFDTATGELVAQFAHTPPVLSCAFHPDGEQLAAANLMGDVRVWRLGGGNQPVSSWNSPDFTSWGKTKSHHYSGGVYSLAFSHGGDTLVGCGMGADPRSDGRQRKDDLAALGLARRPVDRPDQGRSAWRRVDGDHRVAPGSRAVCHGRPSSSRQLERRGLRRCRR